MADKLRVRWHAHQDESGWVEWIPADLEIELNGVPLKTCKRLEINFVRDERLPEAVLSFTVNELDIDAETMTALEAYVDVAER